MSLVFTSQKFEATSLFREIKLLSVRILILQTIIHIHIESASSKVFLTILESQDR